MQANISAVDFIPLMVEAHKPLFATLSDAVQAPRRVREKGEMQYAHSFTFSFAPGPSEKINDPVFGQITLRSNYNLILEFKGAGDRVTAQIHLELFHNRYGIEERYFLPTNAGVTEARRLFSVEARNWGIKHESVLVGDGVVRQFFEVLDGISPQYKKHIHDASSI